MAVPALIALLFTALVSGLLVVWNSTATAAPACNPRLAHGQIGSNGGAGMLMLSDEDLRRELAAARAAGVDYMRVDIDWSQIEPERDQWNWENTDRVVNAVVAEGLCPLGLLAYTPEWATNPADRATDSHFRPADPADFARFAGRAGSRYSDRISAWEVWNEPNVGAFYKPAADVRGYADLLAAAYDAVKTADGDAFILTGGLSPASDGGGDISPVTFVKALYDAGAQRYFDAVGTHPYTFPALPNDPDTKPWSAFQQLGTLHDVMSAHGDGGKPIWLTEFGAPTGTSRSAVSEDVQAETIAIVLQAARTTNWMGPAFIYGTRDAGNDPSDIEQNFGVLRRDFTQKKAYEVVQEISR